MNLNLRCKQHNQLSEQKNKLLSVDQMVTLILKQKSLNMSIYQQERLTDSYVFGNELMFD